jgi:hypothetical protein
MVLTIKYFDKFDGVYGAVRDIYWAMRPKPSVGPLIVIEANCSS